MYSIDGKDSVHRLDGIPQSSTGSPLPVLVSDEHSTLIGYLIQAQDPDWDGTTVRVVGLESTGELVAIVRFKWAYALMFGPPNDEAFSGHPLASRGLTPYAAVEVRQSSWIRSFERMNRGHPFHKPESFAQLRHFILSFHDSTFECIANDISLVESFRGSMSDAATRMAKILTSGQ
jgi:hypothetical protein